MSKFLEHLIRSQEKHCGNKINFKREESATRAAAQMMAKKPGETFEAYQCIWCEGWHIGHPSSMSWLPDDLDRYTLMILKYDCRAGHSFYTNTVISNRILERFRDIETAEEYHVTCPECRTTNVDESGRKLIELSTVDHDSIETLESLFSGPLGRIVRVIA